MRVSLLSVFCHSSAAASVDCREQGAAWATAGAGSVVTIGNFDGVHRGHQTLLVAARQEAVRLQKRFVAVTFEPHPREFFAPQGAVNFAPKRISTLRDKLAALAECGVEQTYVLRFTQALAAMSAERFIDEILVNRLHAQQVWVGDDFRFGAQRAGDYGLLQRVGAMQGFSTHTLPTVSDAGGRISSSAVRSALAQGDVARATALLGRPLCVSGHVLHGQKLGRTLGFPTLNLRLAARTNHARHGLRNWQPAAQGIFVVQVHGLAVQPIQGVASLGRRPTVEEDGRYLLEVYLFNWDRQVYGKLVQVELLHQLRAEEKYIDLPTLQTAIAQDVANAQAWLANRHQEVTQISTLRT